MNEKGNRGEGGRHQEFGNESNDQDPLCNDFMK